MRMANESNNSIGYPQGLAPHATGRVPGPLGGGVTLRVAQRTQGVLGGRRRPAQPVGAVRFNPANPIATVDASFTATEKAQVLAALQLMTDDQLRLSGTDLFDDGTGKPASNLKVGQLLLRGLQYPTGKVTIAPQSSSFIPDTKPNGNSSTVEVAFSSGNLTTFHFFVMTGANTPGPGGNAVEKSPGYICIAHELVHAYRILRGLQATGAKDHDFWDAAGDQFTEHASLEELTVVGIEGHEPVSENLIRAEHGLGSRTAYASPTLPLDKQGVKPVSTPPKWWPDCPTP